LHLLFIWIEDFFCKQHTIFILYQILSFIIGRNFAEILRVIDSVQLTAAWKVATPVDWEPGASCMVIPSVQDDELEDLFPMGTHLFDVPSKKKYLRTTPQPES